jgi:adenylosuccinate lyase
MTTHHPLTPLNAISPLDGRYRSRVEPLAAYVSESALIRQRLAVEVAYFLALLEHLGLVTGEALDEATGSLWGITGQMAPDDILAIKAIERHTRHDVKAVEYWLKEQARGIPALIPHLEKIHLGLTSEDVNNLAYGRMHQFAVREVVLPRLQQLMGVLGQCAETWADVPMLALTHGQPATPTTLGKEMAVFGDRLRRAIGVTAAITLSGKLNGATGTWGAVSVAFPDVDWPSFSDAVVRKLGLEPNRLTTQIEPNDRLAELFDSLRRINGILLDLCRDLWLYVSRGIFQLQAVDGEIGSSAMPHKVNPIDFENAEGNFGIANALLSHLATTLTQSRLQRDLSGSTVMRNCGVAMAHGYLAVDSLLVGLSRLQPNGEVLARELADHPEVLAEAIQTVLRAHGVEAPYEQLKSLTRGHRVTLDQLHQFIAQAPVASETLQRLLAMTPGDYVGLAPQLARAAAAEIRMASTRPASD